MRGMLGRSMLVLVVSAPACTSASGDVTGGELRAGFDAEAPPALVSEFPGAKPTEWRGLYRDFFSKGSTAGCGRSTCHGTAGKGGTIRSNFVCADVDGCWESLRHGKHVGTGLSLVEATAISDPASAEIFKRIRYVAGSPPEPVPNGATMPEQPSTFAFSADDIGRMKDWIKSGALNN